MNYGGFFDVSGKELRINELNLIMGNPSFWNNKDSAEVVIEESNALKKSIDKVNKLKELVNGNLDVIELLIESPDEELQNVIENDLLIIEKAIDTLKLEIMLSDPSDKKGAILEIHAGAGGTESCDWASMLMRMYLRWCDSKNFKYDIIDEQNGEEAGIKSVSILVKGFNAYGYLKSERGVHRLVRISPFDSNKRRHTSFASVEVIPEIENDIAIEIGEYDLKIDVYRSSGAGGQSVNTTDSAVRITHIPSGIVVTCQNERSQLKNKEKALQVLKSKLYQREVEKRNQSILSMKSDHREIEFGSQIRSYVMQPYIMVKDHRTNIETSNVSKVLDGDIDIFIEGYLKGSVSNE